MKMQLFSLSSPDEFPHMQRSTFATQEDAQQMLKIINEMKAEIERLQAITQLRDAVTP